MSNMLIRSYLYSEKLSIHICFISSSEYIFLKKRCSDLATCSNQPLSPKGSRGKSQMLQAVLSVSGLCFFQYCFLSKSSSKNFGFMSLLNQPFRVLMVNLAQWKIFRVTMYIFSVSNIRRNIFQLPQQNSIKNGTCSFLT